MFIRGMPFQVPNMSLFGSSGIRGIVGRKMTPELALRIGKAIGTMHDRVVLGSDSRTSADMMTHALVTGLTSAGTDAYIGGLMPTPTLARAAGGFGCGLMVTASHNPREYNGVKMWNPDGSAFDGEQMECVETLIVDGGERVAGWGDIGHCYRHLGALEGHAEAVLSSVDPADCRVVVDCGCGATTVLAPLLMRRLGCGVVSLNAHPDGHFPGRMPEPTEENLVDLRRAVASGPADMGIAHDGDGDRVVAIDENGAYVGGDALLALFTRGHHDIVAPINASMVLDEMVPGRVHRTQVGDMFVSQALRDLGLEFGGEPSGTYIFASETLCPDGMHAAALLASMVTEAPLSQWVEDLPRYPMAHAAVVFDPERRTEIEAKLSIAISSVDCDRITKVDGHRIDRPDGWYLVRLSGTEPKVRITAEGRDEGLVQAMLQEAMGLVRMCLA